MQGIYLLLDSKLVIMKNFILILFTFFIYNITFSQRTEDVERLRKLSYLKYAKNIDCNNKEGFALEHRICLNLKFQRVDSILNNKVDAFIKVIEKDSIKTKWLKHHNNWIINRRLQSEMVSEGFNGHMLGIYYLNCMITISEFKIKEIEFLRKNTRYN